MKIYSWNVYFENKHVDEIFDFIAAAEFDVFCLQEVTYGLLDRLKKLPLHLAYTTSWDIVHNPTGKTSRLHNVIISKQPFISHESFELPLLDYRMPARGRALKRFLEFTPIWPTILRRENHNGIFADIQTDFGRVRVFCVHLSIANPDWRTEEFDAIFKKVGVSLLTIICGDFNVLETWYTTILSWFMGIPFRDAISPKYERQRLERTFNEKDFLNPHLSQVTHPFSQSQLDHILVSKKLRVTGASVIRNGFGSDHRPVFAEID